MIDDAELLKEFDRLVELAEEKKCFFCRCELTEDTQSEYKSFIKVDGKPSIVNSCLICQEVLDRMDEAFYEKKFVTEKKIRADIKKEGWTFELLKVKQEKERKTIH